MATGRGVLHGLTVTRTWLSVAVLIGTAAPASALQCFSCADCAVGGALSAHKQQCPPKESFCAAVSRPRIGRWGFESFVVDRGCASSLEVACENSGSTSTGTAAATPAMGNDHQRFYQSGHQSSRGDGHGRFRTDGSPQKSHCCSTNLCNGSEDARSEGQRRSEEHRRTLMEGSSWNRKNSYFSSGTSVAASGNGDGMGKTATVDETIADGEDDNSAKSTRRGTVGGSRFATVLVIVGTFSQVLWLVSSLVN